ncbi:MAG: dihydrofolate reductase [Actinomycetaceae bacterium]|nr:dihydrofolate reductase [Actinomycetaceae bacterium]
MIWAQAHGRAIGAQGTMPWHVPEDMAFFKQITMGHPVIMGRKTWQSLPERFRPLTGRPNIVITRDPNFVATGADVVNSLETAYELAQTQYTEQAQQVWIMGGAQIYQQGIEIADAVVVTDLDMDVPHAEAFAPQVPFEWKLQAANPDRGWLSSRTGVNYRFSLYTRPGFKADPQLLDAFYA